MNQPQEALRESASEPTLLSSPEHSQTLDSFICPADQIFDRSRVLSAIAEQTADTTDAMAIRKATVAVLSDARQSGTKAIAAAFADSPFDARPVTRAYTFLTDCLVETVLHIAQTRLHPNPTPTEGEKLAVLAVGGFGRGEMAPHSDVDLLFLTPYKITPWAESLIESMLYMLWDLRLKVGHASRTIRDCIKLAREDYTIRTSLVELRYLSGDRDLAQNLHDRLWNDLFESTASDFIEAKLAERDERHRKQGGQRYVVEPNVKEGKGGLRDIQSLYWIAKYVHRADSTRDLMKRGVFTADEFATFTQAEDFLWAVRCHLHLIAGRAMDQLTFDLQVEVAARMGYNDTPGRRGVELFMQDYFRHATRVGELTRIFLTSLEATHTKAEPMLQRLFTRRRRARAPYAIKHNRLTIADEKAFFADKVNMLRIFEEALRTGTLLHSDAMRLLAAHLDLIDDDVRGNKEANRIFLDLLLKHGNPERALRRMNELGVLAAFIPDFAHIVAMMQFNMYHHYTVDEHTIQCISHLAQIERKELVEELPIASSILESGIDRKVLYVALLCHDVGKGRTEDHSIIGAQLSRRITAQLGLNKKDSETVEWLVRYHLLMSDMAQKRDISDPRTVRDFAKAVKTVERLDLLTVLTVCDIRGVGPDTWNNWKAMLLRGLYASTREALENGMEEINRESREQEAKKALRVALSDWDTKDVRQETGRHYGPYWQGMPGAAQVIFAGLLRGITDAEIRVDLMLDEDRDATRACFAMSDHPGLFSRMTGALALVGANVVDARTYTTKDGYATAIFWIQDADGHPYEASRLPRLQQMIKRTLAGEVVARDALVSRDKLKKREQAFRVATSITIDNEGSDLFTIIEVDTRDRPGLLHDLTRCLAYNNINISSAVIATFGEQVVDSFYVKDMFGLKIHAEHKRATLEKKLREAIEQGAKRALDA